MVRHDRWQAQCIGLVALCTLIVGGCASPQVERLPRAQAPEACVPPPPQRDVLVGVALSGGGSRSALYGAAGLEAIAKLGDSPRTIVNTTL